MYTALIIFDVFLALAIIGLVLLQQGKGADAGAAFGSGSSGTVFGAGGSASVLTKITTWMALAFFVVTLGLSYMAKDRVESAVNQFKKRTSIVEDKIPASQVPLEVDSPLRIPAQYEERGVMDIPQESVQPAPFEGAPATDGIPSIDDIPTGSPADAN